MNYLVIIHFYKLLMSIDSLGFMTNVVKIHNWVNLESLCVTSWPNESQIGPDYSFWDEVHKFIFSQLRSLIDCPYFVYPSVVHYDFVESTRRGPSTTVGIPPSCFPSSYNVQSRPTVDQIKSWDHPDGVLSTPLSCQWRPLGRVPPLPGDLKKEGGWEVRG